ncbi:T6SS phospholipase effector Tle1-like catalytic domain-containing protein, partial [Phaeobacter sp. JH18-31]
AYRFLAENYCRDADGTRDQIYIFGFSRGAYSARVLAGFIHAFGLMEPKSLNLLDYAYRAYKRIGAAGNAEAFAEMRLFERILRPDRPPIRLLGLFDTVASVIESGRVLPRLRNHAHTSNNSSVEAVRHAVATCERRTMFQPQLWPKGQSYSANRFDHTQAVPQNLKEVWFRGVHGDIGGGYPEAESALAKVPLHWMILETAEFGLNYKTRTVNELVLGKGKANNYVAPAFTGLPHKSMNLGWSVLEFLPRRKSLASKRASFLGWTIPLMEQRFIPEGARIHRSVSEAGQMPKNVPDSHAIE